MTTTSSISWLSATAADDISSESEIEIADLEKTELLVPPFVRINPPFFVEISVWNKDIKIARVTVFLRKMSDISFWIVGWAALFNVLEASSASSPRHVAKRREEE